MELAGLQKTSLIDYPGRISCVVFLTRCNFHCPFCHNPDLANGIFPQRISLPSLLAFINDRRKLLEAVVISGGEPTLAPDLAELCRAVRHCGLQIKLDTNGSRPDVLAFLIQEKLVDYIAMDIKTTPGRYAGLTADPHIEALIRRSVPLIMEKAPAYEFRTTCVRPFIAEADLAEIGALIKGASLYVLQSFRTGSLLDPHFASTTNPGFTAMQMSRMQHLASQWVKRCQLR